MADNIIYHFLVTLLLYGLSILFLYIPRNDGLLSFWEGEYPAPLSPLFTYYLLNCELSPSFLNNSSGGMLFFVVPAGPVFEL